MMTASLNFLVLLFLAGSVVVDAGYGHATYYGGQDASGTNNGACGYTNVFSLGYGTMTAALSGALFNNGAACGGCYKITCSGDSACYRGSIVVTATNACPQGSYGGWCDSPKQHFDLSQPAFGKIAAISAGHVSVQYSKVRCQKSGGIRFIVQGHTYFMQVLVYNVGGAGDVSAVAVKGSKSNWVSLRRDWGQNWSTGTVLDGQSLSFKVTTSDKKVSYSYSAANNYWRYGQTFEGSNF